MKKPLEAFITEVNGWLQDAEKSGVPYVMATEDGGVRPSHKVDSRDPLKMTRYGLFTNRAPRVVGELAILGFAARDSSKGLDEKISLRAIYAGPDGAIYAGRASDTEHLLTAAAATMMQQMGQDHFDKY